MEYILNEVRPGEFEVVRSMPVVLGTFTDPDMAQKFMTFLKLEDEDQQRELAAAVANADAEPAPPVAPLVQPVMEPGDTSTMPGDGTVAEPKVHRAPYAPAAKLPDEKQDAPAFSDEAWTDDELKSAFGMLSKGQSLKNVAAWHGKCWKKLRSKWAFHKKQQNQDDVPSAVGSLVPVADPVTTPLEKVTAAVEELAAQEQCQVCQRHFKPTPDNLDLCARCSHGA